MVDVAYSVGIPKGPIRLDRRSRVKLGPLLDMIAVKLDEIATMFPRIEKKTGSKWRLTADQVRLIRSSDEKQLGLAAELRIDPSRISRIRAGKAYEWVED